jgi:hypothetical protein
MWPFSRRTQGFQSKAEFVAPLLLDVCNDMSPTLLMALLGVEGAAKNKSLLPEIVMEEIALGLHLTDRLVFAHCGADQRAQFMDALLPAIKNLLEPPLDASLADFYSTRQQFYASLRFPKTSQDLKGTLFWEFGKALAAVYANSNPVAATMTSNFGAGLLNVIDDLLRAAKIIRGKR